jgi:hypothetical protein
VRRHVLLQAAAGHKVLTLSQVTFAVDRPKVLGNPQVDAPISFLRGYVACWSAQKRSSKLGRRGWVQACLSRLAKEGLLWERQRPEGGPHYHGERADKYFRLRITQQEATARLKKEQQ